MENKNNGKKKNIKRKNEELTVRIGRKYFLAPTIGAPHFFGCQILLYKHLFKWIFILI